ncbi:AtpZ/AtpI family protein [Mucilaginibacter segetis]|uniref:AtpZ/AtpI family protein n=1 Tax=Mucilaginibacter segetis TaxID=2793071 RepID=A0A934PT98_9SPHI|nr:AtpZ/AtpI family protein [Mucilaginibacter segetis]MBK0380418.1 AtpZ/AtpI family protein [Mucilaginibacter segetis]
MAKNEQEEKGTGGKAVNNYIKYTGLGFQMVAIIGLFTFAGYKIDTAMGHTTQWVTAVMSLSGVFISLFIAIRSVRN